MQNTASVFSALVAFGALALGIRNAYSRGRDRAALFLRMHEQLIHEDLQRGRRLLFETPRSAQDFAALRATNPAEYQLINRALAMFDILGSYTRRGLLDKELVLEEWGHTYARAYHYGWNFVVERAYRETSGWSAWPNLRSFGAEAEAWVIEHPIELAGMIERKASALTSP